MKQDLVLAAVGGALVALAVTKFGAIAPAVAQQAGGDHECRVYSNPNPQTYQDMVNSLLRDGYALRGAGATAGGSLGTMWYAVACH